MVRLWTTSQQTAPSFADPGVLPASLDREDPGRTQRGDALQLGDGLSRVRFRARLQMGRRSPGEVVGSC
jgi:hypothetical protein